MHKSISANGRRAAASGERANDQDCIRLREAGDSTDPWWRERRVLRRESFGAIVLTDVEYAPGFRLERHAHDAAFICLVVRGGFDESYRGWRRDGAPGRLFYYAPDAPHSPTYSSRGARVFHVEIPRDAAALAGEAPFPPEMAGDSLGCEALTLALRLYREWRSTDSAAPLAVDALCRELLASAFHCTSDERRRPGWLNQVRDSLNDRFVNPPSLSVLAAEVGVHPAHLARTFHRRFGCTTGEYIRRLRVAVAVRKLAATRAALAEVAAEAGFADQSHFGRVFKNQTGVTPAQYRRAVAE